jgi:hypothetical protein
VEEPFIGSATTQRLSARVSFDQGRDGAGQHQGERDRQVLPATDTVREECAARVSGPSQLPRHDDAVLLSILITSRPT